MLAGLAVVGMAACKKPDVNQTPREATVVRSGDLSPPEPRPRAPRSGAIETLDVPGDKPVLVVVGENTQRPIVHLHGMCTEPKSDLEAWSSSVADHGTVVAIVGDASCPGQPGMATWSMDVAALDARIGAALQAVHFQRGVELDPANIVLIGESMGASRAQSLAAKFPGKYTRLVLASGPEMPNAAKLGDVKKIALLAGDEEPQDKMRNGADLLVQAGLSARFWTLDGAAHGEYGTAGARRMGEALAFVTGAR